MFKGIIYKNPLLYLNKMYQKNNHRHFFISSAIFKLLGVKHNKIHDETKTTNKIRDIETTPIKPIQ